MIECPSCGRRQEPSLICAECGSPLAAPLDCFAALGLPRKLTLDLDALERRYHELSRKIHPDRFASKRPMRDASLARDRDSHPQLPHAARPGRPRSLLARTRTAKSSRRTTSACRPKSPNWSSKCRSNWPSELSSDPEAAVEREPRSPRGASSFNSRWMKAWPSSTEFRQWDQRRRRKMLTLELKTILSNIAYLRTLIRDVDRALENSKAA